MLTRHTATPLSHFWGQPVGSLFDRTFDDLFNGLGAAFPTRTPRARTRHPVHVEDAGKAFVLTADLPGVSQDGLEIEFEDQLLTIKARGARSAPEGFTPRHRERKQQEISWAFRVNAKVDVENASAKLENGTLRVVLPKAPAAQPRSIAIKTAE